MMNAPTHSQSRGRARLGIVVPFSNTNLEPDMQMLRPSGVSLHFARAGGYDLDEVPDSNQMRQFALASLEEVVRFYNRGGDRKPVDPLMKPLKLTEQEIFDIVAFLGALTDPVVIERPKIPEDEKLSH